MRGRDRCFLYPPYCHTPTASPAVNIPHRVELLLQRMNLHEHIIVAQIPTVYIPVHSWGPTFLCVLVATIMQSSHTALLLLCSPPLHASLTLAPKLSSYKRTSSLTFIHNFIFMFVLMGKIMYSSGLRCPLYIDSAPCMPGAVRGIGN